MMCDHVLHRLPAYLDNEIVPPEHDAISEHLAHCERCRAEKEQLLTLWGELWQMPVPQAPADLADKVMRVIRGEDVETTAEPIRFSRLLPVSAAVAAVVAITGLVVGGWFAWVLLDAETERQGERSIAATMDVFAPNPQGSFVGGYIAMLENPGRW
jgi:anti-sigma factor RsiW